MFTLLQNTIFPITCMALLVSVSSIDICPDFLVKVPCISNPLPFSAGNQHCLGGAYIVGVVLNPNMSPKRPVVDGAGPPISGPPPS